MARLFGLLVTFFFLAACSSGVSNSGAGGEDGGTGLVSTMSLDPASFSSDAFPSDTTDDGEIDQLVFPDFVTVEITVHDPLGRFSNVFQGVNFTTYELTYVRGSGGAPKLGPRVISKTATALLTSGTGSTGQFEIPIVDHVTKKEFRDQASGSTVFNYVARIRAIGRDIATNSRIVAEGEVTIEIGEFLEFSN